MKKSIIIPVDFSKYSEYALKTAATLAQKSDVSLVLVHMLEMPFGYSNHDGDYAKSLVFMIKYAEKKMKTFTDKDFLKGVELKVIIKHFTVFAEIGDLAKEHNASLIIMGSQGSDKEGVFLGSNTEKVVRNSNIPVFVVKNELSNLDFKNTVYVSDFKTESVVAYQKAKDVFAFLDITPKLLFVNTPHNGFVSTKDMNERFKTFLMEADGHLDSLDQFENYDDATVEKGVNYFVEQNDVSLIVIATHGKSAISQFFNQSVSLDIVNNSKTPVLTILI